MAARAGMSATETSTHLRENPFSLARGQQAHIGDAFGVDPNLIGILQGCKKTVEVSVPVSDGRRKRSCLHGHRVVHNGRAVREGGHPIPPARHGRRGRRSAMWMTWKCASWACPSAAQGRRRLRPEDLRRRMERLTRRFTDGDHHEIGPEQDVPAPDVGTDAQVMAWIIDTYSMNVGHSVLGVMTGKPVASAAPSAATKRPARGVLYVASGRPAPEARPPVPRRPRRRPGVRQRRHATLARLLAEGARASWRSRDSNGGVVNSYGLDVAAAVRHKRGARRARRPSRRRRA